jgi:hypothetical protein
MRTNSKLKNHEGGVMAVYRHTGDYDIKLGMISNASKMKAKGYEHVMSTKELEIAESLIKGHESDMTAVYRHPKDSGLVVGSLDNALEQKENGCKYVISSFGLKHIQFLINNWRMG